VRGSAANMSSRRASAELFVVIGAQRTGTNLLREILNTNDQIAMLGEVFTPSLAPAHWDNFCRTLSADEMVPASCCGAEALLDRYFEFVEYRIRNYWEDSQKTGIQVFGVDIKYNQLTHIEPIGWDSSMSPPFLLCYLRSRGAKFIHTTRNVIHSAISTLIAAQRNLWHNYGGTVIECQYQIDIEACLSCARTIIRNRALFLDAVRGCTLVNCQYGRLVDDIERGKHLPEIPDAPGPLHQIAGALGIPFKFRHDGRLQKAINVPYSRLLSNYNALVNRLCDSELSLLASSLS
jgi:LPS sulfotransferase NodH